MQNEKCIACGKEIKKNIGKYPSIKPVFHISEIHDCMNCGLGIAYPMPSQTELDDYYDGHYWSNTDSPITPKYYPTPFILAQSRWQYIEKKILENNIEGSLKLLDIGAGHGFLGDFFYDSKKLNNRTYHAIEPDVFLQKEIIKRNSSKSEKECSVFSNLSDIRGEYDIIAMCHILEHVREPNEFINNVISKLKKNGLLFIEVPNRDDTYKEDVSPHLFFYNKKSLNVLLLNHNLDKIDVNIYGKKAVKSIFLKKSLSFRYQISRLWYRFDRFIPMKIKLTYFRWLLSPDTVDNNGVWLRSTSIKK